MVINICERCSDISKFKGLIECGENETVLFEKEVQKKDDKSHYEKYYVTYVSVQDREYANAIAKYLGWNVLHTSIDIANVATCFALSEEHSYVYSALRKFKDLFEGPTMKSSISIVDSLFAAVRKLECGNDKLVILDMNSVGIDDDPVLIDRLKFCHLLFRKDDEIVTNALESVSGIYVANHENISSKVEIECKLVYSLSREVIGTLNGLLENSIKQDVVVSEM